MTIVGNPVAFSTLDWGLMTCDGINGRGKSRHQLPAGLFAVKSTSLIPAEREIAIDTMAEWLALARGSAPKRSITRTRISMSVCSTCRTVGVDAVIEAVGMESHGAGRLMEKMQSKLQHRASLRLVASGPCMSSRRHRLIAWHVRWVGHRGALWCIRRQSHHVKEGADPCSEMPAPADGADRRREERSIFPHHA